MKKDINYTKMDEMHYVEVQRNDAKFEELLIKANMIEELLEYFVDEELCCSFIFAAMKEY